MAKSAGWACNFQAERSIDAKTNRTLDGQRIECLFVGSFLSRDNPQPANFTGIMMSYGLEDSSDRRVSAFRRADGRIDHRNMAAIDGNGLDEGYVLDVAIPEKGPAVEADYDIVSLHKSGRYCRCQCVQRGR